jgi:hypothetical protein
MSYTTYYHLSWESKATPPADKKLLDVCIAEYMERPGEEDFHSNIWWALETDGTARDWCKWYNHTDEMLAMSKAFPDVLFTLSGEGEENGDLWKKYYLNGQYQEDKAEIVYKGLDTTKWINETSEPVKKEH